MSWLESIVSQILKLVLDLSQRARAMVTLALVAIVTALIWVLATSAAKLEQPDVLVPAGGLFGLAVVFLVAAAALQLTAPAHTDEAPGGEFVIGCTLGRRTTTCGVLRVVERGSRTALPRGDQVQVFTQCFTRRLPPEQKGSGALYDELAEFIHLALREAQQRPGFTQCTSIGVGTPGIVNLQTGQLTLSVSVPEGADIPHEIARRLVAKESPALRKAFPAYAESERLLARRIYVDNDVRCIARHELSKHGRDHFMCLYAGSGVGGALVVGGQVYYGTHGSAAHIGHIELEAPTGNLPLLTGQSVGPAQCDCGRQGFHLEAFASYSGLRRLTEAVVTDAERGTLEALIDRYAQAGTSAGDFYRDGLPNVIAAAGGRSLGSLPEPVRALMAGNRLLAELSDRVLKAYVGVLASGIVTITHTFDPGVVVACGPLIERLRENDLFARYLRACLPPRLLDERAMPHLAGAVAHEAQWQGAALTAWDPSYHRLRKHHDR